METLLGEMARSANHERRDELGEPSWLLEINTMSAVLDDFELGLGQHCQVALCRRRRDNPVFVAPDEEGRNFHIPQEMRQGLAIHVGLPRDAKAHLTRDVPGLELVRGWLGVVDFVERLLIME